jgi:hypothetical protein
MPSSRLKRPREGQQEAPLAAEAAGQKTTIAADAALRGLTAAAEEHANTAAALQTAMQALQSAGMHHLIMQQAYNASAFPFPVPTWASSMSAEAYAAFQHMAASMGAAATSSGGLVPQMWSGQQFGTTPAPTRAPSTQDNPSAGNGGGAGGRPRSRRKTTPNDAGTTNNNNNNHNNATGIRGGSVNALNNNNNAPSGSGGTGSGDGPSGGPSTGRKRSSPRPSGGGRKKARPVPSDDQ